MSSFLPKSIQALIEEFSKLPGIGPKMAQRLTMHLLHSPNGKVRGLAGAVDGLKEGLQFCRECWNIAEDSVCRICAAAACGAREARQICVVEEILDVVAIEKTGEFKGVYHVLHGALSPVNGIGPDQLKVAELIDRVRYSVSGKDDAGTTPDGDIAMLGDISGSGGNFNAAEDAASLRSAVEVILATNPGLEGETTALYLMRLLTPLDVRVTRIARGLPVGGDLDYADEMTLTRALQGRADFR